MSSLLKTPYPIALLALAISLALAATSDIPVRDVGLRFAPMAEAFASGDWSFAFHPRVPPLFPVSAGILAYVFGLGGFTAAKIASSLFFAAGVFPLFGVFRRVFDLRTALLGALLYALCSHLLRLASSGLRESAKGFAFILAIYGLICLYQRRERLLAYIWLAIGSALLTLCRAEGLLFALIFLGFAGLLEFWRMGKPHLPWRSGLAFLLGFSLITPALMFNYHVLGYLVPEGRLAVVIERFCDLEDASCEETKTPPPPRSAASPQIHAPAANEKTAPVSTPSAPRPAASPSKFFSVAPTFLLSLIKGFYPYFMVFSLAAVIFRLREREFKAEEWLLLAAILGHALLIVLQIIVFDKYLYVSRRYLLPVAPLGFCWAAWGALALKDELARRFSRADVEKYARLALCVIATALVLDAAWPQIKILISKKKAESAKLVFSAADWLKADYKGPSKDAALAADPNSYVSNKLPLIFEGDFHGAAYLAGGHSVAGEDFPLALRSSQVPRYCLLDDDSERALARAHGYVERRTFVAGNKTCSIFERVSR